VITGAVWLLFPDYAQAWTPGTHVYLGEMVLGNLHLLPSSIGGLIQAFPFDFLYGSIAPDSASANIVLPQGTVLPIFIQNLSVPVDQKVLAELNVAVDIPLNETDLHEPFVGLQQVVEPYYCMVENQQVFVDGANVCP
jgi:hypothetical protein